MRKYRMPLSNFIILITLCRPNEQYKLPDVHFGGLWLNRFGVGYEFTSYQTIWTQVIGKIALSESTIKF
jgi:hypothetical protein